MSSYVADILLKIIDFSALRDFLRFILLYNFIILFFEKSSLNFSMESIFSLIILSTVSILSKDVPAFTDKNFMPLSFFTDEDISYTSPFLVLTSSYKMLLVPSPNAVLKS